MTIAVIHEDLAEDGTPIYGVSFPAFPAVSAAATRWTPRSKARASRSTCTSPA